MSDAKPYICLAPIGGILLGFAAGWAMSYMLRYQGAVDLTNPTDPVDMAGRSCSLVFSIFGWAIGVVVRNKRLYCGGTEDRHPRENTRYVLWGSLIVFLAFFAFYALGAQMYLYYSILAALIALVLCAEVGWGSPFGPMAKWLRFD